MARRDQARITETYIDTENGHEVIVRLTECVSGNLVFEWAMPAVNVNIGRSRARLIAERYKFEVVE